MTNRVRNSYTTEILLVRALNAEHDLREAKAEIVRHHRDFALISAYCDAFDKRGYEKDISNLEFVILVRKLVATIRGIVG